MEQTNEAEIPQTKQAPNTLAPNSTTENDSRMNLSKRFSKVVVPTEKTKQSHLPDSMVDEIFSKK